jgi:hypothetical protein
LHTPPPGKTAGQMELELREGAALFSAFWNAPIPRVAVENPVMHGHAKRLIENYAEPAQSIQPWQFGHGETKRTCLWLRNLPPLRPTNVVEGREQRVHRMPPSPTRWKERSRFYPGIAAAMAEQWTEHAWRSAACPPPKPPAARSGSSTSTRQTPTARSISIGWRSWSGWLPQSRPPGWRSWKWRMGDERSQDAQAVVHRLRRLPT